MAATPDILKKSAKNHKPGPGRPKGSLNKTTASAKAALIAAFDKLGGVPSLVEWGKNNPSDFYRLWGKMVPTEVSGPDGGAIEHVVKGVITWGDTKVPL